MKISDLPRKQAKRYLEALQDPAPHKQLLIKVGGGLLEDKAETMELVEALVELTRRGVHVLLVHGGGPQLTEAIKREGNATRFINGVRYTDETTLRLAKSVFTNLTNNLVQTFNNQGVKAAAVQSTRIVSAKRDPDLGFCGKEVTAVAVKDVADAMERGEVLIMNSLASDVDGGDTLNVNSDTIFRALAAELKPHRMVSLTQTGGVFGPVKGTNSRELLSGVDVRNIDALVEEGIVNGGMALKLRELASVLDGLEAGSAISITKPSELLAELLTDQGSGTFVCKGLKIIRAKELDDLYGDFSAMIADTFKKSLPDDYDKQKFEKIYFTPDHLAFGIITRLSDGTPYLDKLAVSPEQQGRGVGESLWYCVARDYPNIVWRSHINNRYATWYHRHADIMKRSGEWILFGRGMDFPELEALEAELVSVPHMR